MYLFKITNTNTVEIYIVAETIEKAIEHFNSKKLSYGIKSIEKMYSVEVANQ